MLESFIPSHYQVIVEVGVGVLRRTDGHLGEPDLGDGDGLHGGGDGVLRPVAQTLVDDAEGGGEGCSDHGDPEHAPEGPRAGDQRQARDGGALQEVRHQVHTAPHWATVYTDGCINQSVILIKSVFNAYLTVRFAC